MCIKVVNPMRVDPVLATAIGLNECIVLLQLDYWIEQNKKVNRNLHNGYYWTFNSYTEWQEQLPFMSYRTIQRTFQRLENLKLVTVGNFNRLKIDRTKWYRINYEVVEEALRPENRPMCQNGMTNMSEWHNHLAKLALPLPETNTETTTETTVYITLPSDDIFLSVYKSYFKHYMGSEHMKVTPDQLDRIYKNIDDLKSCDISVECWTEGVEEHFRSLPDSNNGNIIAFLRASHRYFTVDVDWEER